MARLAFEVRAYERPMAISAALTMTLMGAAVSVVASAADALFLARVGPSHLGFALAVSSALLILILGRVGTLADRTTGRGRGTLFVHLCVLSSVILLALAVTADVAPAVGGVLAIVCGKQLSASIDLVFWVLAAQRLDARQNRRLVPIFIAAHGLGSVVGAFAVGPLAHAIGGQGALAIGGVLFGLAGVSARRFASGDLPHTMSAATRSSVRSEHSMLQVVRHSALASRLALLIAAGGVFAPILYVLMGTAASDAFTDQAALTEFFGQYRGFVQIATLMAQVVLAPWLITRAGVAAGFLLAPGCACLCALALGATRTLLVVVAAQAMMKVFDAAIQTPAEKLAQNLLPRDIRGRVAAFLDGIAKRTGAIVGGGLASILVMWPNAMVGVLAAIAFLWLLAASQFRRSFSEFAVAELGRGYSDDPPNVVPIADERTIARLRSDLVDSDRQQLALELLSRLGEHGRVDMIVELAQAVRYDPQRALFVELLTRLECLDKSSSLPPTSASRWRSIVNDIRSLFDVEQPICAREDMILRLRTLGLAAYHARALSETERREIASVLEPHAANETRPAVCLTARIARARVLEQDPSELIDNGLTGDAVETDVMFDESRIQLAQAIASPDKQVKSLLEHSWTLLRGLRRRARKRPDRSCSDAGLTLGRVLVQCERMSVTMGELILLRAEVHALARSWVAPDASASLEYAGIVLLSHIGDAADVFYLTAALGRSDRTVRRAAMTGLTTLGVHALDALLTTSRYGRRRARRAAANVLGALRISQQILDQAIIRELRAIDTTAVHLAAVSTLEQSKLLQRRMRERIEESTYVLFAMLQARIGNAELSIVADSYLSADPGSQIDSRANESPSGERARALEALDTLLPRELALQIAPVLEDGSLALRGRRAAQRLGIEIDRDSAVRARLTSGDPVTRALVVHALGSEERARFRDDIFAAAADAAREADPLDMLQRITRDRETAPETVERNDMPRLVEAVIALSQVSLFSELTTRQLGELAEVVYWQTARPGEIVVRQGESGDAMYFVASGRLRVDVQVQNASAPDGGKRTTALGVLRPGEPFGEMALFEREPRSATVSVVEKARIGRISRADFEALVDDMPSIALAICRVLSRRVREQNSRVGAVTTGPT